MGNLLTYLLTKLPAKYVSIYLIKNLHSSETSYLNKNRKKKKQIETQRKREREESVSDRRSDSEKKD
jgi:hypothetical protein